MKNNFYFDILTILATVEARSINYDLIFPVYKLGAK